MTRHPHTRRTTRSIAAFVAGTAVRVTGLLGLDAGLTEMIDHLDDSPDAPIGAGLLAFAAVATVAFLWAAVDASRSPVVRVIATWCVAGVLAGVGMALSSSLVGPGDFDADVMLADLADLGPFLSGLIIVPALFATLVVGVPRSRVTREQLAAR